MQWKGTCMFKESVRCFWRQGALLQNRAFLAGSAEGRHHLKVNEWLFSCLWLPWIPTPLLKRSAVLCLCWNLVQNLWKIKCILPTWNSIFRFITLTEFSDTIKIGTDHFPYSRIMARVCCSLALTQVANGIVSASALTWMEPAFSQSSTSF